MNPVKVYSRYISRAVLLTLVAFLPVLLSTASFRNHAAAGLIAQDPLTEQQRRGKQIYFQGTTSSGEDIVASVGDSSLEVAGNVMACANCHGAYGHGKPEGAIRPSNLTWSSLSKATTTNRIHPPYTERSVGIAITQGKDPAGNKLRTAMPRFQLSAADLADLIAYLKRLGYDRDPGVSDNKIVIGTILPKGSLAPMGQSIKATLTAYFTELNSQGGIYNRTFELKFVEASDSASATRAAVERFIKDEQVFALTAAFIPGAENEIVTLMDQLEVPLIGPLTLYPQTGEPLNRQVFYLLAGINEQARVLVDFAAKQAGPKKIGIAVVYPRNKLNSAVVEAVTDQCKKNGLGAPQTYDYAVGSFDPAAAIKQVKRTEPSAVLLLGSGNESLSFMREADKLGWFPSIYGPAAAGGSGIFEAPAGFDGKIFFSFPTAPADQSAEGIKEFRALAEKYKLPAENVASQLSTYGAAKVLVEGLKRAGKDLNRAQLVQSLEGLSGYQTGVTPAITYGPNRRIGALGAYVVTVDLKNKKYAPASGWIVPN